MLFFLPSPSKKEYFTATSSCVPKSLEGFANPALVVGHPGHELKVFGWISEYKPRVYVLTDGSGRQGVSRLPSTTRLLAPLEIEKDNVFGLISDAGLYRAILAQNISWFLTAVDCITESFIENEIDLVVADAMEGFNPAHDICRTLVDAAVVAVSRKAGRTIANYKFCLTEWEHIRQEYHNSGCAHFELDDDTLRKKISAADEYAELQDEVCKAIALRGREYFRIECLKKVTQPFQEYDYSGKPDYEIWGEQRVAEGAYESIIRHEAHMFPIIDAIRNHVAGSRDRAVGGTIHACNSQTGRRGHRVLRNSE
jgi:hypothetical protein